MVDDLYIAHHGIKGQKWGVRQYQNPDGSLTPAGEARYQKNIKKSERASSRELRLQQGIGLNDLPKKGTKQRLECFRQIFL